MVQTLVANQVLCCSDNKWFPTEPTTFSLLNDFLRASAYFQSSILRIFCCVLIFIVRVSSFW